MHGDAPDCDEIILLFARAVTALAGGRFYWELADRHFAGGESIRSLCRLFKHDDQGRPLNRTTLKRKVDHAWDVAVEFDLLPNDWKRTKRGGQRIKLHTTGSDLYRGDIGKRHNGRTMAGGSSDEPSSDTG